MQVGYRRVQADASSVLRFDLIEDLTDRAAPGELTQFAGKVLATIGPAFGLALQGGVDVLRDIT
ncbi:MAG: hypothetical protein ACRDNS_21570 [Trebonia sp.]